MGEGAPAWAGVVMGVVLLPGWASHGCGCSCLGGLVKGEGAPAWPG